MDFLITSYSVFQNSMTVLYLLGSITILSMTYYILSKTNVPHRARYEWLDDDWVLFSSLPVHPGLSCYGLDETQEKLIYEGMATFSSNKDICKRLGIPHKWAILIQGPTGSGKTALIHALSAELDRDLFYIDWPNIATDIELRRAFMSVPPGQIIVLEDIDMTKMFYSDLRSFHDCLDGQLLSGDNIICITSKEADYFDTSTFRAGRIDTYLSLEPCTRYQIRKIYQIFKEYCPEEILAQFPEKSILPCDLFAIMLSCHDQSPETIFTKILSKCHLVKRSISLEPDTSFDTRNYKYLDNSSETSEESSIDLLK